MQRQPDSLLRTVQLVCDDEKTGYGEKGLFPFCSFFLSKNSEDRTVRLDTQSGW